MPEREGKQEGRRRSGGERDLPRLVVGLGASAGGLDALKRFFGQAPERAGIAYVVIQHLDPDHATLLPELLSKTTKLPVAEVEEDTRPEPDRVYVIPPNASLTLEQGTLVLGEPVEERGRRTPIDQFFSSLAGARGPEAVCVVLSGTGSDGTLGLKAVKEHGGMAIAQSAESAQYDGMPRSAMSTGLVDHVLLPEAMPERIVAYAEHLEDLRRGAGLERLRDQATDQLDQLTAVLERQTDHDFSRYKGTTLARRVQRRIQVVHADSVEAYIDLLGRDREEAEHLFRDLLIGVTEFFRDRAAFEALDEGPLAELVASVGESGSIRVWVPGCASGEEAYSIAILLCDRLTKASRERHPRVQIFATDIDVDALEVARRARYPRSIADQVPPRYLERYFVARGETYEVARRIREMCIFSPHNLITHAPFSRVHLVSCRNLLIYLSGELQREVLDTFHYALADRGHLFLGPSESITGSADLFEPVDRTHRIYRRLEAPGRRARRPLRSHLPGIDVRVRRPDRPLEGDSTIEARVRRTVLDEYAPVAVLIDRDHRVLYASGRTGRYLELPVGSASLDLLDLSRHDLRRPLRSLLHRLRTTGEEVIREGVTVRVDGDLVRLRLVARPLDEVSEHGGYSLVVFQEMGSVVATHELADEVEGAAVEHLEQELKATKENLQTTIEELETSNEELKSSNQELLSMNEELQSTNEELQTSQEELQSTNEELETLNVELEHKIAELDAANADLQNLFESTEIAIIFLDRDLRIKRFTPQAKEVFRLIDDDTGRHLGDITPRFGNGELIRTAVEVLHTLEPLEERVHHEDRERQFLMRVLPYHTLDDEVDGIVLTFTDVTELRRLQEELRRRVDELAAADARKDEFLAMLAHELRNPLAPLVNGLALLRQDPAAERAEALLDLMERQAGQLGRLVDDLLDVSRITRGKIELRKESLDLRSVVRTAVETATPGVENPAERLELELPDDPVPLCGDAVRLQQVVQNLLHNAAKYSDPHEPITLGVERSDGHAVLRVTDRGMGMAPEVLERAFELFVQGEQSLARSDGGLGVGLTTVQRLVELHGGSVVAESDGPGTGSTFTVRLPLGDASELEQRAPASEAAVAGDGPSVPRRVLIVEDNRDAAEALAELVGTWGHETRVAYDGPSGVEAAADFRPQVILLDIGLPGMDGFDVATAVRRAEDGERTLVVALTGYGHEGVAERALESGFDRHLLKPTNPTELRRLIAEGRPGER